jgi:hypothetical protein
MKALYCAALTLVMALASKPVLADTVKNYTVGVSSSATTLGYKNNGTESLTGLGLTGSAVFADDGRYQWAGRLNYAYMEHENISTLRSHNTDLSALWGRRLNREGFSWAIGAGLFNERWHANSNSATFSGVQLVGSLGYRWQSLSIDFWLNLRNGNAYKAGNVQADVAVNGALALSYRF